MHAVVIEASFLVAYLYICPVTSSEVTFKIICACSGSLYKRNESILTYESLDFYDL